MATAAGRVRAKNRVTAVCFAGGHPQAALDEFLVLLGRHSSLSGEDVSFSLKVELVQKGITDDALQTHLVRHASRLF